jgi:hypothetical protein
MLNTSDHNLPEEGLAAKLLYTHDPNWESTGVIIQPLSFPGSICLWTCIDSVDVFLKNVNEAISAFFKIMNMDAR